jgi:hypothetical protein
MVWREYALIVSFVFLVEISVQSSFLQLAEKNLASHMILEHAVFFAIGAMSVMVAETALRLASSKIKLAASNQDKRKQKLMNTGYIAIQTWTIILRRVFGLDRKYWFIWVIIPSALLGFWHYPPIFDLASANLGIHILQHISFIAVGATGFVAIRLIGESFRIILLFALCSMMGFAGLMFSILNERVYLFYSVQDHNDAGTYMLILSIVILVVCLPLYLVHRTIFHIKATRIAG